MTVEINPKLAADLATGGEREICVSLNVPAHLKDGLAAVSPRYFWLMEFAISAGTFISSLKNEPQAVLFVRVNEKTAALIAKSPYVTDIRKATIWDRVEHARESLAEFRDEISLSGIRKTIGKFAPQLRF